MALDEVAHEVAKQLRSGAIGCFRCLGECRLQLIVNAYTTVDSDMCAVTPYDYVYILYDSHAPDGCRSCKIRERGLSTQSFENLPALDVDQPGEDYAKDDWMDPVHVEARDLRDEGADIHDQEKRRA